MDSDTTLSLYCTTGYCGDKRFLSMTRPGRMTTANSEPAAVLGCAVLDMDGNAYFSPAKSHIDLLSEVERETGVVLYYDEVGKGFYNSQGVFMSRRQTKAYMLINNLKLHGVVYDEVYSDNIWPTGTANHQPIKKALSVAHGGRVGTVSAMMEQKRQLKRAKQLKRRGI